MHSLTTQLYDQHLAPSGLRTTQKWRERCGLGGFRPHDMRHTVGMRLREAGVSEATRADILWHTREGMTAHYSMAQVLEIRARWN